MKLNLTELKAICEAATPGPWKWQNEWKEDGYHSGSMGELIGILWYGMDGEEGIYCPVKADSEHIATFNPQVALAMIEWINEAEDILDSVAASGGFSIPFRAGELLKKLRNE